MQSCVRWQYLRDRDALAEIVKRFQPLLYGMASERYTACQLDKGVKVTNPQAAAESREIAGQFDELIAEGNLALIEAAGRYDGRCRFSTYARNWVFKRMQEYVRFNWNVVRQPEPLQWKVAKEDQIPRTHPNAAMNPFDNPLSLDKKTVAQRHCSYSTPIDEDSRDPGEWVIGRVHAGSVDLEQRFFGANHFESNEFSSDAEHRALDVETLSMTGEARHEELDRRERQVLRGRFPWACDVKDVPAREEPMGEYLGGWQRYYPRELTRETLGELLGITDERVRQIEVRALGKMRSSRVTVVCTKAAFWGPQRCWNSQTLERTATDWQLPGLPKPLVEEEPLIDKLVQVLGNVLKAKKRWPGSLKNPILYEEQVIMGKRGPKSAR